MIRAWHFLSGDKLRDGTTAPSDGEWLIYPDRLLMCASGLHASLHPFDALRYAPGDTLCLVDCDGEIIHQDDKLVCSHRRIVARMDAALMLRYFARHQALSVIHLWTPPPCVLDYLMGDDAARTAAWAAAGAAARAAARDAAGDAARASDAAWAAAWAAAGAAARAAASEGAWAAAWASDAASDAAWAAAGDDFAALVNDAFEDWI